MDAREELLSRISKSNISSKKKILIILFLVLAFSFVCVYQYSIPQLIADDYNCEEHPGFISESNPAPFESQQHYINRKGGAIKKQLEEVCG